MLFSLLLIGDFWYAVRLGLLQGYFFRDWLFLWDGVSHQFFDFINEAEESLFGGADDLLCLLALLDVVKCLFDRRARGHRTSFEISLLVFFLNRYSGLLQKVTDCLESVSVFLWPLIFFAVPSEVLFVVEVVLLLKELRVVYDRLRFLRLSLVLFLDHEPAVLHRFI